MDYEDRMRGGGMGMGVPMFTNDGRALSHTEIADVAKKKGLCVRCGRKTHKVSMLKRKPLNNEFVKDGVCLGCYPDGKMTTPAAQKFKTAARRITMINHISSHGSNRDREGGRSGTSGSQTSPIQNRDLLQSSTRSTLDSSLDQRGGNGAVRSSLRGRQNSPTRNSDLHNLSRQTSSYNEDERRFEALKATLSSSNRSMTTEQKITSLTHNVDRSNDSGDTASEYSISRGSSERSQAGFRGNSPLPSDTARGYHKQHSAESMGQVDEEEDDDPYAVVKKMRENKEDPALLRRNCHRLKDLGVYLTDAIYEIEEAMQRHMSDTRLLAAACGALWGLTAAQDDAKNEAGHAGAITTIIDALRSNPGDINLARWGFGAMTSLARGVDNRHRIVSAGGVTVMVASLRDNPEAPAIFEWACRGLHSLVYRYDDENEECKEQIDEAIKNNIVVMEEADVVSAVVHALKKHPTESGAQMWAFKLLWRLMDQSYPEATKRVVAKIIAMGGIRGCVQVLTAPSTSGDLFAPVSMMLYNLLEAAVGDKAAYEKACECIPSIVRAIKAPSTNELAQESCCCLLSALVGYNEKSVNLMRECRGAAAVIATMEKYGNNIAVQEVCAWSLWSIPAVYLLEACSFDDIISILTQANRNHLSSSSLGAALCGCLANLIATPDVEAEDIPVEIVSRLLASEHDIVVEQACCLISNLVLKKNSMASRVGGEECMKSLVACLKSSSPKVQEQGSLAVRALATASESIKNALIDAGCVDSVVEKLRESNDNDAVLASQLRLLSTLISSPSYGCAPSGKAAQAILDLVKSRCLSAELAQTCFELLCSLIISSKHHGSLSDNRLLDFLVSALQAERKRLGVLREVCRATWAFAPKLSRVSVAKVNGIIAAIEKIVQEYNTDAKYDADLAYVASGVLQAVTRHTQTFRVTAALIDLVTDALYITTERSAARHDIVENLLDVLLNIALVDEVAIIKCGGVVAVIDAMVDHEGIEGVQERGCAFLALLSSSDLQVKLIVAETDGVDMIICAMACFSENKFIQAEACKALAHLSTDNEPKMMIAAQGGLLLLTNAMRNNSGCVELIEEILPGLCNLIVDADEQLLIDSNVVGAVVSMMAKHPGAAGIQEKCLSAIQNISMRKLFTVNSKELLASAGAIKVVLAAIREFMGSPFVLERAFTTLWSLAVWDKNQVLVAKAGGIGLVINAMLSNIESARVQRQGCGCLCTLSTNARNKFQIRQEGGVDAIVFAMWAHYDSLELQTEACRALSSLAVNAATNEIMLASEGEINAIVSAMRHFPQSEKLQEHACVALRNFSLSTDNAGLIRQSSDELVLLMNTAAARFPQKCAQRATQVLEQISY